MTKIQTIRNTFLAATAATALGIVASQQGTQVVPNRADVPQKLFATNLYDLKTHEGQGAFVDAVVATLHGSDARWGHLKKSPGQTHLHLHGEDSVLYLSNTAGQSTAVDFIGGAGGPNPQPTWGVDQPRYSQADWRDPFAHVGGGGSCPVCTITPPYAGDAVFDAVGTALFADYATAGQAPNPQMGRWFGRTIYDWISGTVPTLDASIAKHRAEWRAVLGLP